jgi:magnesium chelatase family protein
MAVLARASGKNSILLPPVAAQEAALVEGISVYEITSLDQANRFLAGELDLKPLTAPKNTEADIPHDSAGPDFAEIKGQHGVRRAIEVAVAGGHNLLMIGPPGSGKSMIAKRIPGIMPQPTLDEYLDILRIHSAAGQTMQTGLHFLQRPSRTPHHTISDVGLLGGGAIPGPGEISLAHHGVLFLDELPEFKRSALEVLRQPLEDGHVTISRSAGKITLPCNFMLVAAMNPCPCGYLGDTKHECRCAPTQIQRYRARISGPLLDRIDLHIEAPALSIAELRNNRPGESSAVIRQRIAGARQIQLKRFTGGKITANARMSVPQVKEHCALDAKLGDVLQHAMEQLSLSARAYDRILKVARTIADLASAPRIESNHLLEAIQYRSLDRSQSMIY